MTPIRLKAIRKKLKLTQAELADHIGYDTSTVAKWEQGVTPIPKWMEVILAALRGANGKDNGSKQRGTSGE